MYFIRNFGLQWEHDRASECIVVFIEMQDVGKHYVQNHLLQECGFHLNS